MNIYRRGNTFTVRVPTRSGQVARATGTSVRAVARDMAHMLDLLGSRGRREWDVLDAVIDNRITVAELYDAYKAHDLDGLRARLRDVDLAPYLDDWRRGVASRVSATGGTAERYFVHVSTLIEPGKPFPRSMLTYERLTQWLASLEVGPSTRRKYHAAMASFCTYLRSVGVLDRNPVRDVKAPPPAPPRMSYLDQTDVLRVVEAQPEPYRTLSALLHGTGIEVSVALSLLRRDIDAARREVRARGTKTRARDRVARVADWAWPFVAAYIALLTTNAPLFPGINRWTASDQHRATCGRLEIEDYRRHDARHTYAVRAIRAGAPFEVVARQLGHADTSMVVRVYGRFRPSEEELRGWERIAQAQVLTRRS